MQPIDPSRDCRKDWSVTRGICSLIFEGQMLNSENLVEKKCRSIFIQWFCFLMGLYSSKSSEAGATCTLWGSAGFNLSEYRCHSWLPSSLAGSLSSTSWARLGSSKYHHLVPLHTKASRENSGGESSLADSIFIYCRSRHIESKGA